MLHRLALRVLACGLVLAVGGQVAAKCRTFESKPKTFASMELLLHKRLPKKGDGVAIKFGGMGQILSVIKFDDDNEELTDALLQDKLREVAGGIRHATELRGDKVLSSRVLTRWTIGKRTFHAETVTATYKYYDVTAIEYVGLSRDADCFFMVRFTNAADPDDASSLARYKDYVEQAHMLLLKREDVVAEPEEPETDESEAGEEAGTSKARADQ